MLGQTRAADSSYFKELCLFSSGKPPIPAGIRVWLKADGSVVEGREEPVAVACSTGVRLPLCEGVSPCCEPRSSPALFYRHTGGVPVEMGNHDSDGGIKPNNTFTISDQSHRVITCGYIELLNLRCKNC